MSIPLAILGGGPAGLAAGHAAAESAIPCAIFEAGSSVGGNCRTVSSGDFLFDTGAHRLHDRDPVATTIFRRLLDGELREVTAPSRIAFHGRYVNFPLSPVNVLSALGLARSTRAVADVIRSRFGTGGTPASFEELATAAYGRTVAEAFLLGYSEKLWGRPCRELSPAVAGARLRGLGIRAMLGEVLPARRHRARHLDGKFMYPHRGIGRLAERLAEACGGGAIHLRSSISRVLHDGSRVTAVVVNGRERRDVGAVVSTVPLSALVAMLDPAPPPEVLEAAARLQWRHLLLVALFLRRPSVTPCATVYFPDPALPFTRVYEPRNRSAAMAPPGHTSLVAEIPCADGNGMDALDADRLVGLVREPLEAAGWVRPGDVVGSDVRRLSHAYPVLDLETPGRVALIHRHLERFGNLRLAGRPGAFAYSHLHEQLREGREAVSALRDRLAGGGESPYRATN